MKHTNGDLLKLLEEAGIHTTEDNISTQAFLPPYIAEAQNGVIDLGSPFTVVLPKLEGENYNKAVLAFINNDGSLTPQSTAVSDMEAGKDTERVIDNATLDTPFSPGQSAMIIGLIQNKASGVWVYVPESDVYTFTS